MFGRDLLGYDVRGGVLIVNEPGAQIVRDIFRKFVNDGKGAHTIARELNEAGVPTARGGPWRSSVILRILRNEKYCGDLVQKKTYTPDYLTHEKIIAGRKPMSSCAITIRRSFRAPRLRLPGISWQRAHDHRTGSPSTAGAIPFPASSGAVCAAQTALPAARHGATAVQFCPGAATPLRSTAARTPTLPGIHAAAPEKVCGTRTPYRS